MPRLGLTSTDDILFVLTRLARRVATGIIDAQQAHAINSICHTALAALRVKNDLSPGGVGTRGMGVIVNLQVRGAAGVRIAAATVAAGQAALPQAATVAVPSPAAVTFDSERASPGPGDGAPADRIERPASSTPTTPPAPAEPLFGFPSCPPFPTTTSEPIPPPDLDRPPTDAEAAAALEAARSALGVEALPADEVAAYWAAIAEARRQYAARGSEPVPASSTTERESESEPLVLLDPPAPEVQP